MSAARSTVLAALACAVLGAFVSVGCGEGHRYADDPNDRGVWRAGGGSGAFEIVTRSAVAAYVPPPVESKPTGGADVANASPTPSDVSPSRSTSSTTSGASSGSYKVVEVKDGGSIHVVCRLVNAPPEIEKIIAFKHRDLGCTDHQSERCRFVKKGDGDLRLGNCKIYLRSIREGKDWPEPIRGDDRAFVIDQKACVYVPHIGWTRPSTQVVVKNSDRADHNIHGNFGSDTKFNFASEPGTRKDGIAEAYLEAPGTYFVKCDIHPWMNAYIHLSVHPYVAITPEVDGPGAPAGEATLDDVPPGTYELVCWHEGMVSRATDLNGVINGYVYSAEIVDLKSVTVTAKTCADVKFDVPYK